MTAVKAHPADLSRQLLLGLMTTRPPLQQRIRAFDPDWDGKFTPVGGDDGSFEADPARAAAGTRATGLARRNHSV